MRGRGRRRPGRVDPPTLLDRLSFSSPRWGTDIPAGQVELVATDREYEGRGLVRALMRWAHERSRPRRGHLAQVMIGIPVLLYRQFGYQYAMVLLPSSARCGGPAAAGRTLGLPPGRAPARRHRGDGRTAGRGPARLRPAVMPHSPGACWGVVGGPRRQHPTAGRAGRRAGRDRADHRARRRRGGAWARSPPWTRWAAYALLAHQPTRAGPGPLKVAQRPGRPGAAELEDCLEPPPARAAGRLLHPGPRHPGDAGPPAPAALGSRLPAASELAADSGEIVLSFFRHHVRMAYADSVVGLVRPGGPMQAPAAAGGAGIAPDLARPAPVRPGRHRRPGRGATRTCTRVRPRRSCARCSRRSAPTC